MVDQPKTAPGMQPKRPVTFKNRKDPFRLLRQGLCVAYYLDEFKLSIRGTSKPSSGTFALLLKKAGFGNVPRHIVEGAKKRFFVQIPKLLEYDEPLAKLRALGLDFDDTILWLGSAEPIHHPARLGRIKVR